MTAETLPAYKRFARFCNDAKSLLLRETLILRVTPARLFMSYHGSTLFGHGSQQVAHLKRGRGEQSSKRVHEGVLFEAPRLR